MPTSSDRRRAPAARYNYNMFSYLDAAWIAPWSAPSRRNPWRTRLRKLWRRSRTLKNRGAIRSVFDGRYRFSRYFSPLRFNRPTTYEALVADNDLEVDDLEEDPEETRNLAQDGKAKGVLIMALNDTLNPRELTRRLAWTTVSPAARWPLAPEAARSVTGVA